MRYLIFLMIAPARDAPKGHLEKYKMDKVELRKIQKINFPTVLQIFMQILHELAI